MKESTSAGGRGKTRRRSQRVLLNVPVRVNGQAKDGPFEEETETLAISAYGALIRMTTNVTPGQKLVLINRKTEEEQECVVVHQIPTKGGSSEVGVEFTHPKPKFWRVAFPPEDWTPKHPDARARTPR